MVNRAPVKPEVLTWALSEAGLDTAEVAMRSGVALPLLERWLTGEAPENQLPTTTQLRALAKTVNRSVAALLAPAPPPPSARLASFRTPVGRSPDRELLPAEQVALRSTARWQRIVGQLRTELGAERTTVPSVSQATTAADAEDAARVIARWLSWDPAAQRAASSSAAALKLARQAFENRGVLTLQFSLGYDACKGFSVPDVIIPAVAVNGSYNSAARLYSLFHEAAHLVRGDRVVCEAARDDTIESWCESVAAQILIPRDDLLGYLDKFPRNRIETVQQCSTVANHYNVSLRATAVRLKEVGRADATLWTQVSQTSEKNVPIPNPNAPRQTTPVIRRRELGGLIPSTLIAAQREGALSEFQVRRYLDVNGAQLRELAEHSGTGVPE